MKKFVVLGLVAGLLSLSHAAHALKSGPRLGLVTESFNDGSCYKTSEIGLQLSWIFERQPKKECRGGNCQQALPMMPVMPMAMPVAAPAAYAPQYIPAPAAQPIAQAPQAKEVYLMVEPEAQAAPASPQSVTLESRPIRSLW